MLPQLPLLSCAAVFLQSIMSCAAADQYAAQRRLMSSLPGKPLHHGGQTVAGLRHHLLVPLARSTLLCHH